MHNDLDDIIAVWKATKLLSPLLLMAVGGLGSLIVYYLREMGRSMKHISEVIVRHEERIERLENQGPVLSRNKGA